jgi:hypothetical protein
LRLERLEEKMGARLPPDANDLRKIDPLDSPGGQNGPDPATAAF